MIPAEPEKRRLRDSVMMKMLVIGFLILLLLVPLAMVGSLVAERQSRSSQAAEEVASTWGRSQTLAGPVLTVPYLRHVKNDKGVLVAVTSYARFLPERLDVEGNIATEKRSRGIFEVAVYRTDLRWKGTFARPDFEVWRIAPEDVLWQDSYLSVGVPDMRGITSGVELMWGNRTPSSSLREAVKPASGLRACGCPSPGSPNPSRERSTPSRSTWDSMAADRSPSSPSARRRGWP